MDARTRKALEESIAHWERMRDDRYCGEEPSSQDCALCRLFRDDCGLCPVITRGKIGGCGASPFSAAVDAWGSEDPDWPEKAQAEIDFLKSLREEEGNAEGN